MKFLGIQPYFEVMQSQFHDAKFLGVQHMSVKCSYYSPFMLFLGVHVKASQKYLISQCRMKSQEELLSDTDTSTDPELIALDNLQCSQPSPSTLTAPPSTAQLQTKKTTNHQMYKGYSGRHCII